MRLVVDANILVSELLRERGRRLVADERLELFIATKVLEEALHELEKRIGYIARRTDASVEQLATLLILATAAASENLRVLEPGHYQAFEQEAQRRMPRDFDDWHSVALALSLDAAIWTQDKDFLGCGIATWTMVTLLRQLET